MTTELRTDLKNETITDNNLRYCEIYKMTNTVNQKVYIGQAISHLAKRNKFIPHGMEGRFRAHVIDAFGNNNSKYGCRNLNRALKKYGSEKFTLQLLHNCKVEEAYLIESEEICKNNSLSPVGYNLTTTCNKFESSDEFKNSVSNGVMNYHIDKRIQRLLEYKLKIDDDSEKYVTPKLRNNIQCGWRVRLRDIVVSETKLRSNKEVEFSSMLSLEENKKRAIEFLKKLKELSGGNVIKLREVP